MESRGIHKRSLPLLKQDILLVTSFLQWENVCTTGLSPCFAQCDSVKERVSSFGMIQIRISDPRSRILRCIKGTEESTLGNGSSVPLMHHDPSDLGSLILIWIIPKERTHSFLTSLCNKCDRFKFMHLLSSLAMIGNIIIAVINVSLSDYRALRHNVTPSSALFVSLNEFLTFVPLFLNLA